MTRRDGLIKVIDLLHAKIAAMKTNDVDALDKATNAKLAALNDLAAIDGGMSDLTFTGPAPAGNPNNRDIRIHLGGTDKLFQCFGYTNCVQVGKTDGTVLTRSSGDMKGFSSNFSAGVPAGIACDVHQ